MKTKEICRLRVVLLIGCALLGGSVTSLWAAEGSLIDASRSGDIERVRSLVGSKADVNLKDENGRTALMNAVTEGHIEVVRMLLEAKADVNAKTENGDTALICAAQYSLVQKLAHALAKGMLKEAGIEADSKGTSTKSTQVEDAKVGEEIVRALLAARADVNARNGQGQTALMYASIDGNPGIVRALLAARADVKARNKEGQTALGIAKDCKNDEVVKLLRAAGARE